MQMSRRGTGPVIRAFHAGHERGPGLRVRTGRQGSRFSIYLVGSLIAASFCMSAAQAVTFGHSRIVSSLGQPLHLEIPVTQLSPEEIDSLRAVPAPPEAWREAGMTPPVALDSIRLVLLDGYRPDVKVIQLRSDQVFDQPIVDVLLDVRSVSGQQRYQVSLVAYADTHAIQRAGDDSARHPRPIDGRAATAPGAHEAAGRQITVRNGDTMFSIARRNAVEGVTVYQMMMALQRTNPQAFIHENVNLVRAGATLTMPDMDALTALSDREARRLFAQHAQAFALLRRRSGGTEVAALATVVEAAQGELVEEASAPSLESIPESAPAQKSGDRLRLSGGPTSGGLTSGAPADSGSTEVSASVAAAGSADLVGSTVAQDSSGAPGIDLARNGGGANAPVSLLAASGAIASDAVTDKAPSAITRDFGRDASGSGFGSDATSGGTVVNSGSPSPHPDDVAATKKGVDESQKRILELEDNVRHLNEALQKQGHVAAEAALEGARSVSEVFKEMLSLVDPDAEEGQADGEVTAGDQPQEGGGSQVGTPPQDGSGAETGTQPVENSGSSNGRPTTGAGSADAPTEASSQAYGTAPAADGAAQSDGSATVTPGVNTQSSPSAGSRAASAPPAAGGQGSRSEVLPSRLSPNEPAGSSVTPVKTEKQVSWFQENMLALIGAGLALIVAIIVWLLRRAGAAKRDAFESDSPITDSMLHEKLREIDLDLDSPPTDNTGPRS